MTKCATALIKGIPGRQAERWHVVAFLPDREMAIGEAWLRQHPSVGIVSRDRGGSYEDRGQGVAGRGTGRRRWHLMENASAASLDAVQGDARDPQRPSATTIDPALLTAAERLQDEGFSQRKETEQHVMALEEAEHSIEEIARRTRHSRKLVRQAVRGEGGDVFRIRRVPWQLSCRCWMPGGTRAATTTPNYMGAATGPGLPRLLARRGRVGDTAAVDGQDAGARRAKVTVGSHAGAADDHGMRSPHQG